MRKLLSAFFALSLPLVVLAPLAAAEKRPNILYIMADDHAAHAISAYGSKINQAMAMHLSRPGTKSTGYSGHLPLIVIRAGRFFSFRTSASRSC